MPRAVSTAFQTQADQENLIYTEVYNVTITGAAPLYLTPTPPTVSGETIAFSFGGLVYQSFAITRSEVRASHDTEVDGVTVKFQNVDQVMTALILNNDIRGSRVTISGVMLASGTNAPISSDNDDLIHVFDGSIGAVDMSEEDVQIQLNRPIKDIRTSVPRRFYSPPDFPFRPVGA